MKVLVIGSGAREHAIAEALQQSKKVETVFVSPGNDGIAKEHSITSLPQFENIKEFVLSNKIDFVFVGPEQPLAEGIVDYLQHHNINVVGPMKAAARIESSKAYAKNLMKINNIPTAIYEVFTEYDLAKEYLEKCAYPQVLKADGLAAGKGVIIVSDINEAIESLKDMMLNGAFGTAGDQVVIEEFMEGWETSIFAFTDGIDFISTIFSQDHKAIFDEDKGPNTGGMGAYAPVKKAAVYHQFVDENIFTPVLEAMKRDGNPFQGILYAGLMVTDSGPRVVEFNCRFGDPETQVILPLLKTDFADICTSIFTKRVKDLTLEWSDEYAVNVVAASKGYPDKYEKGMIIADLYNDHSIKDAKVYYSGVKNESNHLVTNGGRVLSVTAKANDLVGAIDKAYKRLSELSFEGKTYRTDIGKKGLI